MRSSFLVTLAVLTGGCELLVDFDRSRIGDDAGLVDARLVDRFIRTDAGPQDAGPRDAGPEDAGVLDAGPVDAGPLDGGPTDAGRMDGGPPDSGPVDLCAGVDCSTLDTQCAVGVCRPTTGMCELVSRSAGTACNDGLYCTVTDVCDGAGSCAGTTRSCDDGLGCTSDTCNETADACVNTLTTGCIIGGVCVATDALDPANDCRACQPGTDSGAYTNRSAGASCNDGLGCTGTDVCDASAVCAGTLTTGCLIDSACVAEDVRNAANDCEACVSATDPSAWTVLANGTSCDDGNPSTSGDLCTSGVCAGT